MDQYIGNSQRAFLIGVAEKLGHYVYTLQDPENGKIFYVGKGGGTEENKKGNHRLFAHFNETEKFIKSNSAKDKRKCQKIKTIWSRGDDVLWHIVRHKIDSEETALKVEAALIDTLNLDRANNLTNSVRGHGSTARGMLTQQDVSDMAAPIAQPAENYPAIFIFAIQKALARGREPYEATRKSWEVAAHYRGLDNAIAIGIQNGICRGAYRIDRWENVSDSLWQFHSNGPDITDNGIVAANWNDVINRAKGYWQYGNYLVVEYNVSKGFRFLRGNRSVTFFC